MVLWWFLVARAISWAIFETDSWDNEALLLGFQKQTTLSLRSQIPLVIQIPEVASTVGSTFNLHYLLVNADSSRRVELKNLDNGEFCWYCDGQCPPCCSHLIFELTLEWLESQRSRETTMESRGDSEPLNSSQNDCNWQELYRIPTTWSSPSRQVLQGWHKRSENIRKACDKTRSFLRLIQQPLLLGFDLCPRATDGVQTPWSSSVSSFG